MELGEKGHVPYRWCELSDLWEPDDLTAELLSQRAERHLRKLSQLAQEGNFSG